MVISLSGEHLHLALTSSFLTEAQTVRTNYRSHPLAICFVNQQLSPPLECNLFVSWQIIYDQCVTM